MSTWQAASSLARWWWFRNIRGQPVKKPGTFAIRIATLEDVPVLQALIQDSVRILQAPDYTPEQLESALAEVYGVDTQLIRDGTYFAAELDGFVVGCGGWSRRKTLFGSDHWAAREDKLLDPTIEPARIRAFFIRPGWERRGIGSAILRTCEAAAMAEGFTVIEMASTLTGVPLYRAHGYAELERINVPLASGLTLPVVRMAKAVGAG
jgi:GNAT superfamily N-acetyltransferase